MKLFSILVMSMLLAVPVAVCAQETDGFGVWVAAGAKKKLTRKWSLGAEAELRTRSGLSDIERWSVGVLGTYGICKNLKADCGYTLLDNYYAKRLTSSQKNYVESYWLLRHRFYVSLTGSLNFGNLTLSLRERYQLTCNAEKEVGKYKVKNGSYNEAKIIEAKTKQMLRSRIGLDYSIKGTRFTPFASFEFNNELQKFSLEKTRLTVGSEVTLTKKQELEVAYKYNRSSDSNEACGHVLGVAYKLKL